MSRSKTAIAASARRRADRLRKHALGRLKATDGATTRGRQAALGTKETYGPTRPRTPVNQHRQDVPPHVADARIAERWRRLRAVQRFTTKKLLGKCKTPIGSSHVGIATNADGNGAHLVGLQSCANVWACPCCAPKIRAARMVDVLDAFDRHTANGGGFAFLTITLWHQRDEALADLLDLLGGAWKYVAAHRSFKEAKQRLGMVGNITALEVTDGGNGWHPHRHVMLMFERPPSRDAVAAFEAVIDSLFSKWLHNRGRKHASVIDPETGRRVGVRLDYVPTDDTGRAEQLGRYLTKMQASFELTRGDLKQSRTGKAAGGRLPMDLIDVAASDDPQASVAVARWREYEQAMTGKSCVRFSKGLRKLLGMQDAKTDEELAEEEVGGDAGVYMTKRVYMRAFNDGHVPALLLGYRMGGDAAVLRLLTAAYPGRIVAQDGEMVTPGVLLLDFVQ